jgi:apolipoprotein N-acyltransferase
MPLPLRLVLAACAGAVVAAGFEPYGLALALPLGVAGLHLLLTGSARSGFLVGAAFGSAFMLLLLPWLQVIGHDAWVALSVVEGIFYGLLGLGGTLVRRLRWWPVWAAALWVGVEALRGSFPFGGFPWGRLAFATPDTPAVDLARYVGAAGTTFLVALLGTTLAWALPRLWHPRPGVAPAARAGGPLAGLAGAVLLVVWASALPAPAPGPDEDPPVTRVAVVQGDVPGEGMDAFAERRVVLENHVEATHRLADRIRDGAPEPDLVVWPENSTDIDPFSDPTVHADIQGAVDAVGVPVLVGAMVAGEDPTEVLNQGILWRPGTGPGPTYSKQHPVPFGEYIPMRDLVAPLVDRLDQIPRDMAAGDEPGLFEVAGQTVGDVICFEIAYDDVVRDVVAGGADFLVVQTNNATYMGTGQVEQQWEIARLRAVETGRHVVVSATNGVTGLVGPDGEVVARAPVREQVVLTESFPVFDAAAPGLAVGQVVATLLSSAGGLGVLWAVLRSRRRGPRGGGSEGLAADPVPTGAAR